MFDIGWSEMAVIALIALVVIGPKELPNAMRTAAKWARKARSLAREFQSGVDDMVREADLEDARKALDVTRDFDVGKAIEDTLDPTGSVRDEAADLEATAKDGTADDAFASAAPDTSDEESGVASGGDEEEVARVIETPANIAPPHSLTPPPEEGPAETPPPADDGDSEKQA